MSALVSRNRIDKPVKGLRPLSNKDRIDMKYIVRFGGFILWEGDDVGEADEILQGCGPYGTLEVEE